MFLNRGQSQVSNGVWHAFGAFFWNTILFGQYVDCIWLATISNCPGSIASEPGSKAQGVQEGAPLFRRATHEGAELSHFVSLGFFRIKRSRYCQKITAFCFIANNLK